MADVNFKLGIYQPLWSVLNLIQKRTFLIWTSWFSRVRTRILDDTLYTQNTINAAGFMVSHDSGPPPLRLMAWLEGRGQWTGPHEWQAGTHCSTWKLSRTCAHMYVGPTFTQIKLHALACALACQLHSWVSNRPRPGSGLRPRDWGPLPYDNCLPWLEHSKQWWVQFWAASWNRLLISFLLAGSSLHHYK